MNPSRATPPALHRDPARDIVITASGVWSAAGTHPSEFAHNLTRNHGPARVQTLLDPHAVVIPAPDPPACPRFPQARRMDRAVHLALAAAAQAWDSAGLDDIDPTRIALLVGNSRGPAGKWAEPPPVNRRVRPTQSANTAIASLSGAVSLAFQIQGPCLTVSAACASAAHAIALGASLLLSGDADVVIAGGAEAPLVPPLLDQFLAAGLVGHHPDPLQTCRPFDATRNGTVPGEGAAFLVLESAAHARARRQTPLARLAGWALASEAHNRVATRADGAALVRVIHLALQRASLTPADIGHVNAHGTGTQINDIAEAAALHAVFSPLGLRPPVSSTKPITGHTFGAAPALEAVAALLALQSRLAPPTWASVIPDPALPPIHIVRNHPHPIHPASRAILSTSLGFWGNTAAIILAATDDSDPAPATRADA